jgi:hypothetical protein
MASSLLFANLDDVLWFDCFVSSAALGIKKLQKFLERCRIGRVPQEGTFAANLHQSLVFQFV